MGMSRNEGLKKELLELLTGSIISRQVHSLKFSDSDLHFLIQLARKKLEELEEISNRLTIENRQN